jgi:hypothetical protein
MFTDRYDKRIWDIHLRRVLPNLDAAKTVTELRQEIYADLEHFGHCGIALPIMSRFLEGILAAISTKSLH